MENPIKMDDLGVPLFLETPTCGSFGHVFFLEKNLGDFLFVLFFSRLVDRDSLFAPDMILKCGWRT